MNKFPKIMDMDAVLFISLIKVYFSMAAKYINRQILFISGG